MSAIHWLNDQARQDFNEEAIPLNNPQETAELLRKADWAYEMEGDDEG